MPSAYGLACAADTDFEAGVLFNANRGGENVHSGSVIGALLGAASGMSSLPPHLIDGLKHADAIRKEVDGFTATMAA